MAIGQYLVASPQFAEFYNPTLTILLGLCIIGFSAGLITVPVLPEMIESIETR